MDAKKPGIPPALSFRYSAPVEMLLFMSMMALEEQIGSVVGDLKIELEPDYVRMREQAKSRLSGFLLRELDFFFNYSVFSKGLEFALLRVAFEDPGLVSVEAYLDRLEAVPVQMVLRSMVEIAYWDKWDTMLSGDVWNAAAESAEKMLRHAETQKSTDEKLHTNLLECLRYPEETKRRYCALLRSFYEHGYRPLEREINERSQAGAAKYERMYAENPERFIKDFMLGFLDAAQKEIAVHISFSSQVTSEIYEIGPTHCLIFGIHNDRYLIRRADRLARREQTELLFKTFADKKRLDIAQLISERPWYGQEIAAKLELTPAAVTYHLNYLYPLQLISSERIEHRVYFSLDKQRLAELLDAARSVLLNEEEDR